MFDLSIIIPTIRTKQNITSVLESVRRLGLAKLEVILVNDNKSRMLDRSDFDFYNYELKVINNIGLRGACAARNLGLKSAQGDYCHFLDDDDEFLDLDIDISNFKNSDVVCYNAEISLNDGSVSYKTRNKYRGEPLIFGNSIGGLPRFLFKRKFLMQSNIFFPENLGKYQDLAFLGRIVNSKPAYKFFDTTLVKVHYSMFHTGISSKNIFNIFTYYRALLSFSEIQDLKAHRRNIIRGFLEQQSWYVLIAQPGRSQMKRLLLMDFNYGFYSLILQHSFISLFPKTVLWWKAIR